MTRTNDLSSITEYSDMLNIEITDHKIIVRFLGGGDIDMYVDEILVTHPVVREAIGALIDAIDKVRSNYDE